jgi:hypothetical protein
MDEWGEFRGALITSENLTCQKVRDREIGLGGVGTDIGRKKDMRTRMGAVGGSTRDYVDGI